MTKARLLIGAGLVAALGGMSSLAIPAIAASADDAPASSAGATASGPLLTVCLTVNPKSISVSVNGETIGGGTAGVPRNCVSTPF